MNNFTPFSKQDQLRKNESEKDNKVKTCLVKGCDNPKYLGYGRCEECFKIWKHEKILEQQQREYAKYQAKLEEQKEENKPKKLSNIKSAEPQSPLSKAIAECDKWFSRKIRLICTDDNGWGMCATSERPVHYNDADCGHWISRRKMATRFHEQNTWIQSVQDNRVRNGEYEKFQAFIAIQHGEEVPEKLLRLAANTKKYDVKELNILAKKLRNDAMQLARHKMFEISWLKQK